MERCETVLTDKLKALAEKATPGPWNADSGVCIADAQDLPCIIDEHRSLVASTWDDGRSIEQAEANAALIVALVNNLPTILTALESLPVMREAFVTADEIACDAIRNGYYVGEGTLDKLVNARAALASLPKGVG